MVFYDEAWTTTFPMRLAFPNGEHEDVMLTRGAMSIGSSSQDHISVQAQGIEANHLRILLDKRGLTLHVSQGKNNVVVNSRKIHCQAILRLGDRIDIGDISCLLVGEEPDPEIPEIDDEAEETPIIAKAHLRALNGRLAGKLFAIPTTRKGESGFKISAAGSGKALALSVGNDWVAVRKTGSFDLNVNGNRVSECVLTHGDQIAVGSQRFCIEAPGLKLKAAQKSQAAQGNTQVFKMPDLSAAQQESGEMDINPDDERVTGMNMRDRMVLAGCLVVSLALLVYLGLNL